MKLYFTKIIFYVVFIVFIVFIIFIVFIVFTVFVVFRVLKMEIFAKECIKKYNNQQTENAVHAEEERFVFGVFITINQNNRIVGCLGTINKKKEVELYSNIKRFSILSAFYDDRYLPLNLNENYEIIITVAENLSVSKLTNNNNQYAIGENKQCVLLT